KMLPESVYPTFGALGWTLDSKSLFYDSGKISDLNSPEIKLNRKTRLHKLGTPMAKDVDFFSNESYPDLGIAAREFPGAFIDEAYPDYLIGYLGTVQNEMRMYYAPISEMKNKKIKWQVLAKTSDNLVRGLAFHKDQVYAVTHQGAPHYKVVR